MAKKYRFGEHGCDEARAVAPIAATGPQADALEPGSPVDVSDPRNPPNPGPGKGPVAKGVRTSG